MASYTPKFDAEQAEALAKNVDLLFEAAAKTSPTPHSDEAVIEALKNKLDQLENTLRIKVK